MRTRSYRAVVALMGMALALGIGLTACSDDSDSGGGSVPVYHEGDSITVGNGKQFVIELTANPSTGYSWDAGKNPNVKLVSSKQVAVSSAAPGAPGTQRMTFKAYNTGSSTLELAYARPFEGGVPPAQTASFDVKVQ
jgi:inhibitor of cysteine peptidase